MIHSGWPRWPFIRFNKTPFLASFCLFSVLRNFAPLDIPVHFFVVRGSTICSYYIRNCTMQFPVAQQSSVSPLHCQHKAHCSRHRHFHSFALNAIFRAWNVVHSFVARLYIALFQCQPSKRKKQTSGWTRSSCRGVVALHFPISQMKLVRMKGWLVCPFVFNRHSFIVIRICCAKGEGGANKAKRNATRPPEEKKTVWLKENK